LYRSDDFAAVSWNIWKAWMNFVLWSIQLQIDCGGSREYQLRTGPSQEKIKDLASATSSPPAEFTADLYRMRNCLEFPYPLYFGRETGSNFGSHDAVYSPSESGESGSTKCEIPLPVKKFSRGSFIVARILVR
jgi:hypothetical protein